MNDAWYGIRTLLRYITVRKRGFSEPALVGGLDCLRIRLHQRVLLGEPIPGPGKQVLIGVAGPDLGQHLVPKLGGLRMRQRWAPLQNALIAFAPGPVVGS